MPLLRAALPYCTGVPVLAGEAPRRDTDQPAKDPGEVTLVGEPQPGRYLSDGGVPGLQDALGAPDPDPPGVLHRALAGAQAELPGKVKAADPRLPSQLVQGDPVTDVAVDVPAHPSQRAAGQAAAK